MSVQTELTRISTAKTDIKNVVNSKVANTITNQTIDAFPPLIDSSIAAYKNLIPWIEGSGSSFTIDNAEAGKLDKFEMDGNTHQDSYSGKNLFNKDGTFQQGFLGNSGDIVYSAQSVTAIDYIPVEQNKRYIGSYDVIVYNTEFRGAAFYDENKNYISRTTSANLITPNNCKFMRVYFYNQNNMSVEQFPSYIQNIQIEKGSTATEYEPYVGGTPSPNPDYPQDIRVVTGNNTIKVNTDNYTLNLGNIELCKIRDYKDVIFKNNQLSEYYDNTLDEDSWYIKKEIGKVVVDTSNITLRSNYTNIEYAEITKPNDFIGKGNYDDYNVYCSHAVSDIKNAIQYAWDSTYRIGKITNKAIIDNLWLGFPKGTGLDNIKTALNGAIIYYALATPTYEKITNSTLINQLEAIETHTGTNIFEVSNDNDVLPNLYILTEKQDSYNNWKKREGID